MFENDADAAIMVLLTLHELQVHRPDSRAMIRLLVIKPDSFILHP
jgi:hypothetical protein